MDLYEVYRQVAHLCFPNALVCADHFHVIKNLGDNFNSARIRIMKQYEHLKDQNDNWYWLYKKYWKKLLKNWRQEIINSFHRINGHVISNGGMERATRDIKTIIRPAYGFKNFSRLRNRIMYVKNDDATIKYKK